MERLPESDRWIRSIRVRTTPPSLKDNTGDADRLIKGIEKVLGGGEVGMEIPLSRKIPSLLREHHYHVEVILCQEHSSWHVVDILPSTETVSVYGLAVDLGTSVVAVRLLDIATGKSKRRPLFSILKFRSGRTSSRGFTTLAGRAGSRNSSRSWSTGSIRKSVS